MAPNAAGTAPNAAGVHPLESSGESSIRTATLSIPFWHGTLQLDRFEGGRSGFPNVMVGNFREGAVDEVRGGVGHAARSA